MWCYCGHIALWFRIIGGVIGIYGKYIRSKGLAPKNASVCHPKDALLRGAIPPSYSGGVRILSSLTPRIPVIPDAPSALAHPILWQSPDAGITLVDLFGGIDTGLAAVLEAGLTDRRYIYVDNSQVSTRVAHHHLHQLMVLYPQQLPLIAIRGYFTRLPRDVTLISEANLRHLGPVDMVIAGWPCQGHSCARAGRGLEDPRSNLFWDLIRLIQWWFSHQPTPPGYIFENVPLLEDSRDKVLEGGHYVCQHLGDPILWMPRALVLMPTGLGGFGPTSHYHLLWLQHFLRYLRLLIKRWMTSWIQTGPLYRLFEMIYPRRH